MSIKSKYTHPDLWVVLDEPKIISAVIADAKDNDSIDEKTFFGKMKPKEFNEAAARYARENPYTDNAKVIL